MVLGLLTAILGLMASPFLATWESRVYDWSMTLRPSPIHHSSIVIIGLPDHTFFSCEPGGIPPSALTRTISILGSVAPLAIAPILPFSDVTGTGCGNPSNDALLLESIQRAGVVVLPDSAPPLFTAQAKALGHTRIPANQDGVTRGFPSPLSSPESTIPPLGQAIANVGNPAGFSSGPWPETNSSPLLFFAESWEDHPFPYLDFAEMWALIETRNWGTIRELFEGKYVFIFPVSEEFRTVHTPVEQHVPQGFLHATVLHNWLTQSWIHTLPWMGSVLLSLILATISAWIGLTKSGIRTVASLFILSACYVALSLLSLNFIEWRLPVIPLLLSLPLAGGGGFLWALLWNRSRQLNQAESQLMNLQSELQHKETLAQKFQNQLLSVQEEIHRSQQHISTLEGSARETLHQWELARTDVERTQQHLKELEDELSQLKAEQVAHAPAVFILQETELTNLSHESEQVGILTRDPHLLHLFQDAKQAAHTPNPVLLLGETGTGKEVFAKAIHQLSPWAKGPFVPVNMAAIRAELFESELFGHARGAFTGAMGRRGLWETANGGTIFLDEIGDLGLDLQAKLLRVLEDGSFYRVGESHPITTKVRLIAATNRDLYSAVEQGHFRADLYFRLKSFVISLPPLRQRSQDDLNLLVDHVLHSIHQDESKSLPQISEGAWQALLKYSWPGNIRELRQTLTQAAIRSRGEMIIEAHLHLESSPASDAEFSSSQKPPIPAFSDKDTYHWEDTAVLQHLRTYRFDMQATARAMQCDRSTVTQRFKGLSFQFLLTHEGNVSSAASSLSGDPSLTKIVEKKLCEYYGNLISFATDFASPEEAISHCRTRLKNLPDRHFPAVEELLRQHFLHRPQESISS
jgi:transcriptional regulator with PAS, ATPase and Fis domain